MRELTFVLPLKDRAYYTQIWLRHNVRPEYDYLIADGSLGGENEALFGELGFPNVTYVRFPHDESIADFVEKMVRIVDQVKTPYVMTCDNDDFMNFHGIVGCLDALRRNPDAACAGGPIYGVQQVVEVSAHPRYGLPVRQPDAAFLCGWSGFDALTQLFRSYRCLWYSVFRTEQYQKIWTTIMRLRISNLYLIEILQTELALCLGKYIQVASNHYIRLENPLTSGSRELEAQRGRHAREIFFDEAYRSEVVRISEHIAQLVGVSLECLLTEFANYYAAGNAPMSNNLCVRLSDRLGRLHEIIPRKLNVSFSLEFCIAWINFFGSRRAGSKLEA